MASALSLVFAGQAHAGETPAAAECGPGKTTPAPWVASFRSVGKSVIALRDGAPFGPAWAELQALIKQPCFRWARIALGDRKPDSAAALRAWWNEGGESWLAEAAGQPRRGEVSFPPDFRPSLFLAGNEHEAETPILCAAGDAACGAETRGWIARAEQAFDEHDDRDEQRTVHHDLSADGAAQKAKAECEKVARDAKPAARLHAWMACVTQQRRTVTRFPVGRFRVPGSGWLIIAGRRGHYQFCDGVAAFDLATGSAATVRSCGGLFLQHDGFVDGKKTAAGRKLQSDVGMVSADNARELALNLLLLDRATRVSVDLRDAELPQGVSLDRATKDEELVSTSAAFSISDAQTMLTWSWVDAGVTRAHGKLTWPYSSRAEETHADRLLEILEAGLVAGCPPATPPLPTVTNGSGTVSPIDASPDDNEATFAALRRAFQRAAAGCHAGNNTATQ